MAAHAATSNRSETGRLNPAVARLLHTLTMATMIMLSLLALWLLVRRIGGQLQQPLSAIALACVAGILASIVAWLRFVWYHTSPRLDRWKSRSALVWSFPSAVILVLAIALSIAGTSTAGLLVFWSILLATEGAWWWFAWRQLRSLAGPPHPDEPSATGAGRNASTLQPLAVEDHQQGSASASITEPHSGDSPLLNSSIASLDGEELDLVTQGDESDDPLSDDVSQQITRTFAESEKDTVTGLLRARFVPNARSRSLHVAFCPSMLRSPKVTVIQLSGPRARIKVVDPQSFGLRFDVRLAKANLEEQEVLLHFEACCAKSEPMGLGGIEA